MGLFEASKPPNNATPPLFIRSAYHIAHLIAVRLVTGRREKLPQSGAFRLHAVPHAYAQDRAALALRAGGISTTSVSNSASFGVLMTGWFGSFSDGSYHGRRCVMPCSSACAINLPISSPCNGT